jgi:pyruvate kinase
MQRRTRIVATLGPATDRPGVLDQLLDAGLDVARINFSHCSPAEHEARVSQVRQLAAARQRPVAVLADLPGPKLRALLAQPIEVQAGQKLTLAMRPKVDADVHITEPEALARLKVGQRVLFDDGRLQGRVLGTLSDRVTLFIERSGTLLPNKGINLPDTEVNLPPLTHRDRKAIASAVSAEVDWLALSFVREAAAAHELRGVLRGYGVAMPILAKIERPEAVRRSADIIGAFDGVMVARGDLGVEIELARVPFVQKQLIQQARAAGRPVITATDMLDSMRSNPRPTRAEASDVANAVYDGTDAVMLSGETAVGDYPLQALVCMDTILREAESHCLEQDAPRQLVLPPGELMDHVSHQICVLARDIGAAAVVTPTLTGKSARLVARHRPRFAVVAVSANEAVVRQLSIVWGVQAVPFPFPVQPGDDRLAAAVHAAFLGKAVAAGDLVVVLAGHPIEGGEGYPTIRVVRVGSHGQPGEP